MKRFLLFSLLATFSFASNNEITWDDSKLHPKEKLDMPGNYGFQFDNHESFGKRVMDELVNTSFSLSIAKKIPCFLFIGAGYGSQVVEFLESTSLSKKTTIYVNDLYGENLLDLSLYCVSKGYNNVHLIPGDISSIEIKEFKEGELDAVVAFNLFHYTSPKQTIDTIERTSKWLNSKGKLYMQQASYLAYVRNLLLVNPELLNKQVKVGHEEFISYIMSCFSSYMELKGFNFIDNNVVKHIVIYQGDVKLQTAADKSYYLLSEENWTVLLNKFGLKVDLLSDDENFLSKCFVVSKNKDIQPGNNEADQKKFSVLKNEACNYQQLVDEKIKNKVLQYGLYANSQRELHPFCAVVYNSEQELLSNKMFDIEFAKYLSKKIKESKEYHHKIHNIQFENESNNILRQSGFDPNNPLVASLKKLLKK